MRHSKNNMQNKDDYSTKTYLKKQKHRNALFDIPMAENEILKEQQRQKRDMDRKRPKNRKYMYEEY